MIYYFLHVAEIHLPLPPANQPHSGSVVAARGFSLGETNRTVTFWKYPCIFVALQLFYESQNVVPCIIDFWHEEATVEPRWRQRDLLIHKLEYVCGHIGSITDTRAGWDWLAVNPCKHPTDVNIICWFYGGIMNVQGLSSLLKQR